MKEQTLQILYRDDMMADPVGKHVLVVDDIIDRYYYGAKSTSCKEPRIDTNCMHARQERTQKTCS